MVFQDLEDWIMKNDGTSVRVIKGGDINNKDDIIAMISMSHRVKVTNRKCMMDVPNTNGVGVVTCKTENGEITYPDVWITGPYKTTLHSKNMKARQWCDDFIKLLGFL